MNQLIFIQTGGTIDKDYPKTTGGWAFEFGEPATLRILEKLNPSFNYEVLTACQKDSLAITETDRKQLAKLINHHPASKFIITHGTDTMIETAKYLTEQISNKLIILTGAMRPERFTNSDASINVGCAIGAASVLKEGVYIAMNGVVKSCLLMKRDLEIGKFF